jgi:hypothetical protein
MSFLLFLSFVDWLMDVLGIEPRASPSTLALELYPQPSPCFCETGFHSISGWPWTHCVGQVGLKLSDLSASTSGVLGLQVCASMPSSQCIFFLKYILIFKIICDERTYLYDKMSTLLWLRHGLDASWEGQEHVQLGASLLPAWRVPQPLWPTAGIPQVSPEQLCPLKAFREVKVFRTERKFPPS